MKTKISNERLSKDSVILEEISKKQLPAKVSYVIAKNVSKIKAELEIYNKEREKLIKRYSTKDKNGEPIVKQNVIEVAHDNLEKYNKEHDDLLKIENIIEIDKFNINDLDGCIMSPKELMAIDYMIK